MTLPAMVDAAAAPEVVLEPLTGANPGFVALTFPAYRPLLAGENEKVAAIGAQIDGIPIGLALGQMFDHVEQARGPGAKLLSVMVTGAYRRQGIGLALLRRFEMAVAERGALGVFSIYSSRLPACEALEHTLAASGWSAPRFKELRLSGECGKMIAAVATWQAVQRRLQRDARYNFAPWAEVGGNDDSAAIARLCQQPACARAPQIQPPTWQTLYDPAISIAVRRDGALVGWVAAHRLEPPAGQPAVPEVYYVSYIDDTLQRSGIMVAAYFHAFRLQAAAYGDASIAVYSAIEPGMVAVTRRRFAPIARWLDELRITGKRLAAARTSEP